MEPNWAAQHLHVIRTLMERSAIYRRALAPVMLLVGVLGLIAGGVGWIGGWNTNLGFGVYWMSVGAAAICGAYGMVRRQALRAREIFWSPPTRRVTQALLPALVVGAVASALLMRPIPEAVGLGWWLPPLWMGLYGCAIHAAGFFMPRGIKLFGWIFIGMAGIVAVLIVGWSGEVPDLRAAHGAMGIVFGGLHLAYGAYLFFTEKRKNEP